MNNNNKKKIDFLDYDTDDDDDDESPRKGMKNGEPSEANRGDGVVLPREANGQETIFLHDADDGGKEFKAETNDDQSPGEAMKNGEPRETNGGQTVFLPREANGGETVFLHDTDDLGEGFKAETKDNDDQNNFNISSSNNNNNTDDLLDYDETFSKYFFDSTIIEDYGLDDAFKDNSKDPKNNKRNNSRRKKGFAGGIVSYNDLRYGLDRVAAAQDEPSAREDEELRSPDERRDRRNRLVLILGFILCCMIIIIVAIVLAIFFSRKKNKNGNQDTFNTNKPMGTNDTLDTLAPISSSPAETTSPNNPTSSPTTQGPFTVPVMADTYLRSGVFADASFGTSEELLVRNGMGDDDKAYILLQFVLEDFPPIDNIFERSEQIVLELSHVVGVAGKTFEFQVSRVPNYDLKVDVERLTFQEYNFPLVEVGATFPVESDAEKVQVDITSLIRSSAGSLRGRSSNIQSSEIVLLQIQSLESTNDLGVIFRSREYQDGLLQPTIVQQFLPLSPTLSPSPTTQPSLPILKVPPSVSPVQTLQPTPIVTSQPTLSSSEWNQPTGFSNNNTSIDNNQTLLPQPSPSVTVMPSPTGALSTDIPTTPTTIPTAVTESSLSPKPSVSFPSSVTYPQTNLPSDMPFVPSVPSSTSGGGTEVPTNFGDKSSLSPWPSSVSVQNHTDSPSTSYQPTLFLGK